MPVFLLCFIVFIIWMQVKTKHEDRSKSTWNDEFWGKEKKSNFTRKQDITNLDYITFQESELPFSATAQDRELELQENVRKMMDKKMLNLSGMSNTEIKLTYGTANLASLSIFDQNYMLFIRSLNQWGTYLYQQMPEEQNRAQQIFEYALSLGSDISDTYLQLGQIYREQNEIEKIQQLYDQAQKSESLLKDSILKQLKKIIQDY